MSIFITGTDDATVNDVVLSAQNYSEHYGQHIRMAKANCSDVAWFLHVRNVLLRTWYHNGGTKRVSYAQTSEIACLLREHYKNLLTEL